MDSAAESGARDAVGYGAKQALTGTYGVSHYETSPAWLACMLPHGSWMHWRRRQTSETKSQGRQRGRGLAIVVIALLVVAARS